MKVDEGDLKYEYSESMTNASIVQQRASGAIMEDGQRIYAHNSSQPTLNGQADGDKSGKERNQGGKKTGSDGDDDDAYEDDYEDVTPRE